MSSDTFEARLKTAERICISRAGTGNAASTRELCNCIEQPDGEKLMPGVTRFLKIGGMRTRILCFLASVSAAGMA